MDKWIIAHFWTAGADAELVECQAAVHTLVLIKTQIRANQPDVGTSPLLR